MVAAGPGPSGDADAVAVPAVKGGGCGGGGGGGDVTRPLALLLGGAAGGAPARVVEVASRRTGHALVAHYRGGVVLALGGAVGAPSGSQGAGTAAVEAAEVAQLDPCASGGEAGDCAAAWALPEVAVVDSSGRQHLAGEVARDVLQPREGHVSVCPTGAHGEAHTAYVYGGRVGGILASDVLEIGLSQGTIKRRLTGKVQGAPAAREGHAAVVTGSREGWQRMLVYGGEGEGGAQLADLHALDLASLTWTLCAGGGGDELGAQHPGARAHHAAVAYDLHEGHGGFMVLFGGEHSGEYMDDLWAYDCSAGRWAKLGDGAAAEGAWPAARAGHVLVKADVVVGTDGQQPVARYVLVGGATQGPYLGDVWLMEICREAGAGGGAACGGGEGGPALADLRVSWKRLAGSPGFTPRFGHAGVALFDGTVLVHGGTSETEAALNDTWLINVPLQRPGGAGSGREVSGAKERALMQGNAAAGTATAVGAQQATQLTAADGQPGAPSAAVGGATSPPVLIAMPEIVIPDWVDVDGSAGAVDGGSGGNAANGGDNAANGGGNAANGGGSAVNGGGGNRNPALPAGPAAGADEGATFVPVGPALVGDAAMDEAGAIKMFALDVGGVLASSTREKLSPQRIQEMIRAQWESLTETERRPYLQRARAFTDTATGKEAGAGAGGTGTAAQNKRKGGAVVENGDGAASTRPHKAPRVASVLVTANGGQPSAERRVQLVNLPPEAPPFPPIPQPGAPGGAAAHGGAVVGHRVSGVVTAAYGLGATAHVWVNGQPFVAQLVPMNEAAAAAVAGRSAAM